MTEALRSFDFIGRLARNERRLRALESGPARIDAVFSYPGAVAVSGLSGPYPIVEGYSLQVVMAAVTLGTVDAPNPVTVNFYANGTVFTSLDVPTQDVWAAGTQYVPGDCVEGASGFSACCTVGGTSGGSLPAFPGTIGMTVVDGTVTWETIGLGYCSKPGTSGSWLTPGAAIDAIQVEVATYAGTTAADLVARVLTL